MPLPPRERRHLLLLVVERWVRPRLDLALRDAKGRDGLALQVHEPLPADPRAAVLVELLVLLHLVAVED
eukprot:1715756-Lingulodinium_polyedra.AAC.1